MKFKYLNKKQQKLGLKLHTMCRYVGYDFDDFITVENGNHYYIKSDIIGLRSEGNVFAAYLSESGVYSIERDCPTCGFSEVIESSVGISDPEIRVWLKRELDKSYLMDIGSIEMEHTCEEV